MATLYQCQAGGVSWGPGAQRLLTGECSHFHKANRRTKKALATQHQSNKVGLECQQLGHSGLFPSSSERCFLAKPPRAGPLTWGTEPRSQVCSPSLCGCEPVTSAQGWQRRGTAGLVVSRGGATNHSNLSERKCNSFWCICRITANNTGSTGIHSSRMRSNPWRRQPV